MKLRSDTLIQKEYDLVEITERILKETPKVDNSYRAECTEATRNEITLTFGDVFYALDEIQTRDFIVATLFILTHTLIKYREMDRMLNSEQMNR
jgi:hypothetical protein